MSGSSSITPVAQISKTILGIIRELEAYSGVTPVYDTSTTLNAKYGVGASLTPTSLPTVGYFGIGIGGCFNVSSGNLSEAYPALVTDMDLYQPIPFRCVPVEQDLSAGEQVLYRMRIRKTINGQDYFCYYLKVFSYSQSTVQLTQTDPSTGLTSPYTINYANLSPTPPTPNLNGTFTSGSSEINVSVTSQLPVTGAEITEVVNVFYAGDMRNAKLSEIGLYSGQDRVIQGLNAAGSAINYTEAVLAQLNAQYTWLGDDFSNPSRTTTYQIAHGSGNLLLV